MSFKSFKLGEVAEVSDGAHSKVKRLEEGVPYITSKNIKNGKLDLEGIDFIGESD